MEAKGRLGIQEKGGGKRRRPRGGGAGETLVGCKKEGQQFSREGKSDGRFPEDIKAIFH